MMYSNNILIHNIMKKSESAAKTIARRIYKISKNVKQIPMRELIKLAPPPEDANIAPLGQLPQRTEYDGLLLPGHLKHFQTYIPYRDEYFLHDELRDRKERAEFAAWLSHMICRKDGDMILLSLRSAGFFVVHRTHIGGADALEKNADFIHAVRRLKTPDGQPEAYAHILIFEGTRRKAQWLTNFNARCDDNLKHTGYAAQYERSVLPYLNAMLPPLAARGSRNIFLACGHSAGGALATMACETLSGRVDSRDIYGYAINSPKPFYDAGHPAIERLTLITNIHDIIPRYPLNAYHPAGKRIYFAADDSLIFFKKKIKHLAQPGYSYRIWVHHASEGALEAIQRMPQSAFI